MYTVKIQEVLSFRFQYPSGILKIIDTVSQPTRETTMPTITIPDDTYAKLVEQANALGTTVEELAVRNIELTARDVLHDLPSDEWQRVFAQIINEAKQRENLYPEGFEADVSRESIYEGRGE